MSSPMQTFRTLDGRTFFIPGDAQRVPDAADGGYHCWCHEAMGNDFFFLPMGSCLRADKKCTNPKGQALDGRAG